MVVFFFLLSDFFSLYQVAAGLELTVRLLITIWHSLKLFVLFLFELLRLELKALQTLYNYFTTKLLPSGLICFVQVLH